MSRKPRVQRTPEEKWQIVLESLKSGNVAQTCRKYEIAPNLYGGFAFRFWWNGFDVNDRQWHAVYVGPLCLDSESAGHHASLPLTTTPRATATSKGFIAA